MRSARANFLLKVVGGLVLLTVCSVIGGGVIGYLSASNPEIAGGSAALWVIGAIAMALMIGSLAVGVVWMRSIDEAAREAHKAAWYWGGSGGMAVGGVFAILATLPAAENWRIPSVFSGRTDAAAYVATGAFGLMTLMIIGYTIVWVWWWLARR
jgi:hypothetical protein